jgi:DNA-directed RNA polymerase specialized sigma24 family protein
VRARGDAQLEALWHEWHRHVLAYALRRADPATAEDVVAETFAIAWRRLAEMPDRPLPWLLGVARRVLANHRRGERRRRALVDRLPVPAAPEGAPAGRALGALASLRERDREVLLLHAWEGLDHAEAGTVMGCSAATFAVRLHRARRRFERELERVDAAAEVAR